MAKGVLGFFFGNKPKVPNFTPVLPGEVQKQTIAENAAALPGAESLASNVNQFNLDQLAKALQFSLPGGLEKAQTNISNQLLGISDVEDTKAGIRSAVAAGYGQGVQGSQFGNLKVIGQLGRSVAQQRQQGFQNFVTLSQATKAPQMDPTSMFLSPSQRLSTAISQNESQFNRDWLQSQINAAPHPAGAFSMELLMSAVKSFAGAAGSMAGGCWVAREVYGEENPMWLLFRQWLYEDAPKWFRNAYLRFGPMVASVIRALPFLKPSIRSWMDRRIQEKYGA